MVKMRMVFVGGAMDGKALSVPSFPEGYMSKPSGPLASPEVYEPTTIQSLEGDTLTMYYTPRGASALIKTTGITISEEEKKRRKMRKFILAIFAVLLLAASSCASKAPVPVEPDQQFDQSCETGQCTVPEADPDPNLVEPEDPFVPGGQPFTVSISDMDGYVVAVFIEGPGLPLSVVVDHIAQTMLLCQKSGQGRIKLLLLKVDESGEFVGGEIVCEAQWKLMQEERQGNQ